MAKKVNTTALNQKFGIDESEESYIDSSLSNYINSDISDLESLLGDDSVTSPTVATITPLSQVAQQLPIVQQSQSELENRTEIIIDQIVSEMNEMDNDEKYVASTIKSMISDIADMTSSAKYLISSSPDSETMAAAAQLFNAAGSMLKELNKNRTESKRNTMMIKLEKVKLLKAREAQKAKSAAINMGTGNTINIQQNNTEIKTIQYSQEDIIRRLIASEEEHIANQQNIE